MNRENLTDFIKKGFDNKEIGDYKTAIDYFYKALAIDNSSVEIMGELALLYSNLCQYDRAISFYEQIISKSDDCDSLKFNYAILCKKLKDNKRAKELLLDIYDNGYEQELSAQELFPVLISENEFERVISLFKNSKEEIKSSIVLYFVANAYSAIGAVEKAEEYYNKSYSVSENSIDAGFCLAQLLFDKELHNDAENLCFKLLTSCEDDRIFYLLAEINYARKNIDKAIEYYSYALNLNSKEAVYFYKLGVAYSLKGFMNEAEQSYCKAVTIDSENPLYNYTLAYFYYTNSKYSLAENLVDYILTIAPSSVSAIALKAQLLMQRNEVALAKKYIEKLDEVEHNDDFVYYVQAIYFSKLNFWEKAVQACERAVEINQTSLEYKYELAKNFLNILEVPSVIELCAEILEQNDKYIQAYVLMSKVCMLQGDFEGSLSNIDKALSLDMNSSEVYFIKGCIYYNADDFKKALECYKTAVSIDPKDVKNYAWVAMSYYQLENYLDAYSYFKEAAELDISNPEYRYYMAKCSINNNDSENALSNFSILRRLAPANIEYAQEYADYLKLNGNQKAAVSVMKSVLKNTKEKEEKERIKKIIENFKKKC